VDGVCSDTMGDFSHNYALYLAAGYQNDLKAVKHALEENKLLACSYDKGHGARGGAGYTLVDEPAPHMGYERDFKPYKNKVVDGFTAAHQCATRGFKEALRLLFRHGWSVSMDDHRGKTAADYAYAVGNKALGDWIVQQGKVQKEHRKIDHYLRSSLQKADITLQEFLVRIEYIKRKKDGSLVAGNSLKAIRFLWTELMHQKLDKLTTTEHDFNAIIRAISTQVDGLILQLPLSEDAMRRVRLARKSRD
jgi:hypothetical protein